VCENKTQYVVAFLLCNNSETFEPNQNPNIMSKY